MRKFLALFYLAILLSVGCAEQPAPLSQPAFRRSAENDRPAPVRPYPCLERDEIDQAVLANTIGRFSPSPQMAIARLLHCIRFEKFTWTASDDNNTVLQYDDIVGLVCNHDRFAAMFGATRPYVIDTAHGARFSEAAWSPTDTEAQTREAHVGQTLAILAELGFPYSYPIRTPRSQRQLSDILNDSLLGFNLEQELYWISAALSLYLAPQAQSRWTNKYGHEFDFDVVAERLMQAPVGEDGPCGGTHTLYTLAILLQADECHPILKKGTRQEVKAWLRAAANELMRSQESDGSWGEIWTARQQQQVLQREADGVVLLAPESARGVWITGHHLEWMAIVPDELRVPREQLRLASHYILNATRDIPGPMLQEEACRFSHGLRAIQLLTIPSTGLSTPAGNTGDPMGSALSEVSGAWRRAVLSSKPSHPSTQAPQESFGGCP